MTDSITKLSPPDLDRRAAEVLGWTVLDWGDAGLRLSHRVAEVWHPTQSHDQCQLLVDAIEKRGWRAVEEYADELCRLAPEKTSWKRYLATATPLAKTQAAVAVLRKGE